jgi:hypothetical protein
VKAFRVLVVLASALVAVSSAGILRMHLEMVLLYGPAQARDFAEMAWAGIVLAVAAPLGVRTLGRRP